MIATAQNRGPQRVTLRASVEGGEAGIRTLERVTPSPVFKTGAFNRSATSPERFDERDFVCLASSIYSSERSPSSRGGRGDVSTEMFLG